MRQTSLTSLRKSFLNPLPATRNVTLRRSVYDLTGTEITALRQAFASLQAIADNRGYQYIAGLHGLPQYYCPHANPFFLIWHRPYVLMFEQALQAVAPGMGLPYWDWTSERARTEGIPQLFADPTYTDPTTGQQAPNSLYKAAISYGNPNNWTETFRDPGALDMLGALKSLVDVANRAKTYEQFSAAVEQPHNGLHGWVGGCMGRVPYAAFDPIFWAHHCFIEKLFCDWQDRTEAPISTNISGEVLAPFNKTTDAVWDYRTLGYRYSPEGENVGASARALALEKAQPPPTHVASFELSKVPEDFEQAELNFVKTQYPLESFEVRVFFNEPAPDVQTPKQNNPSYAGSLFTFGHGGCTGGPGHCKVPDVPEDATRFTLLRPEHHLTPKRLVLDVTRALRRLKSSAADAPLDVHLVLVDSKGNPVPQMALDFEMLTLDAV
jgi:tyrosinase